MKEPKYRLKEAMPYQSVEEIEPWRISLLSKFLEIRLNRSYNQDKAEGYSLYIGTCLQLGEYVTSPTYFAMTIFYKSAIVGTRTEKCSFLCVKASH